MTESMRETAAAGPAVETVRAMLAGLLAEMGFEATVEAAAQDDSGIFLTVEAVEASELIGADGQLLEALQYVMNRMLRRSVGDGWFCMIDVGGYRERRRTTMATEALDVAERVRRTGRAFTFPPLSPADRRAVHRALADAEDVETVSLDPTPDGLKRMIIRLRPTPGPDASSPVDESSSPA